MKKGGEKRGQAAGGRQALDARNSHSPSGVTKTQHTEVTCSASHTGAHSAEEREGAREGDRVRGRRDSAGRNSHAVAANDDVQLAFTLYDVAPLT